VEVIEFISGACSCTVKEQNPGVDLLMRHDWDAAAEKLAAQFGAEEGNEGEFGADAFFPELIIPAAQPPSADPLQPADALEVATGAAAPAADGAQTAANPVLTAGEPSEPAAATEQERQPRQEKAAPQALAHASRARAASPAATHQGSAEAAEPAGFPLVATVGIGLLAGLLALAGATFFVLRPHS
jgi:hypothetical protein